MKDLRNAQYNEFLAYVERKILNGLTTGFIFIDEDEVLKHNISFHDKRWISLLEEAGYKIEYCECMGVYDSKYREYSRR
jgi:hypothetical protein|nr:MAG TPA: hypothetical protein [Caudoviricetes sp.]